MNKLEKLSLAIVFTMFLSETTSQISVANCISPYEGRHGDFEISCYYESGYYIEINCHEQFLESLPDIKIRLHEVEHLKFRNCTFSQTTSIQNILNSTRDSVIRLIGFVDFCNSPNRLNFQNLSFPEVVLENGNFSELPYDLFYDVLKIKELDISDTKITSIPKNFFNEWAENVTDLFLRYNRLRRIARSDFTHLFNLAKLYLTENDIDEIESGAFDNLTRLVFLELTQNRLHTLPPGILNQLTELRFILMGSRVPEEYIQSRNYERFIMSQMTSLPPDLFKSAYKLNLIVLAGHNLQSLPLGLFDNNEHLKILDISRNGLKFLPAGIFKGLKRLTVLIIDENRLTSILPEVFIGLHSLKCLRISKNNLTLINARLFNYLKSVLEIDLSYNQITAIEYWNKEKSQLERQFTHTNISNSPNFQQLELLNLNSNYLSDFDVIPFLSQWYFNVKSKTTPIYDPVETQNIRQLTLRKTVDLSNNHISKVNFTALSCAMTKLERFNITNEETEKLGHVTVYLGNNSLNCDCNLMNFIRYLNESSHQDFKKYWMILAKEESEFGAQFTCSSPPELKNRDVRKVRLEEFHCLMLTNAFGDSCIDTCVCQQYPERKFLSVDCSFRNLTVLPEINNYLHNWSIALNMSGNALRRIPPMDNSYLVNITHLDLSSNNITEVSIDAFSPNLRVLQLHNNSISRLDPKIIQYLARENPLRSLTIHHHKWVCNCETHKLLQSSIREKLASYNFHEVLCYGTNRKLYEVTVDELCEDAIIVIIIVSSSIAFFSFIVGSSAVLYYKYQKQIKIWLYSKKLCLWFVTEDELDKDKKYDAFVSFSHKDEDFVERNIIAELEAGPRPYKLCLHYRDWLAGEWIPWQISRSVLDSRRTIIILTANFLESVWGLVEFRAAHTQVSEEGRARLIVVLYGELGNLDDLDQELKDYLSSNTYIKWGDPWFWQKLKYALPHRSYDSPVIDKDTTVQYRVNRHCTISAALRNDFSSIAPAPIIE